MNYDVFISCKSEDYRIADGIYDHLKEQGLHVFLASRELRKIGDAEYREAISAALDSAYHLIVVATQKEHISSKWVKYEWGSFFNEKLSGRKDGNIFTVLQNISTAELPYDLRHVESFTIDNYKEKILKYVETPLSAQRAKNKERESLEARRLAEKQEKERKAKIAKAIKEKVAEAKLLQTKLENLSLEIIDLYKESGEKRKTCPICGQEVSINKRSCPTCCWTFTPLFDVNSDRAPRKQVELTRQLWEEHVDDIDQDNNRKDDSKDIKLYSIKNNTNHGSIEIDVNAVCVIRLSSVGPNKSYVKEIVRAIEGITSDQAAMIIENVPVDLNRKLTTEKALYHLNALQHVGAKASIKTL